MEFITSHLAPIMFVSIIIFLVIGFPVAFSLAAHGLLFAFIGVQLDLLTPALLQTLPERMFGIMANDSLLAIPFFTFMGLILERSGMAEDLLDTVGQLFGPLRGGLAVAVVVVGAMLAATTGVVSASVISMGLISLPIMLRYKYNRKFATGVIAASGTLSQMLPPSLVLIVLADQLGKSIGDMYMGAFLPSFMLIGLYLLYVFAVAWFRPNDAPALPLSARTFEKYNGRSGAMSLLGLGAISIGVTFVITRTQLSADMTIDTRIVAILCIFGVVSFCMAAINRIFKLRLLSEMTERVVFVLVPPIALIFLVLGTIFLGIATPTEGGAMGAVGALVLTIVKKRLTLDMVKQSMSTTTALTCFIVFILIGSSVFSLSFRALDGDVWVSGLLLSLPGEELSFLIIVSILIFVLAFFLDFFELAFIVVPLIVPAAEVLNIDMVWLGIILAINMQTAFLHPPFGFALFYLRSVAPNKDYRDVVTNEKIKRVTTGEIYTGAIPFIVIQICMIAVVLAFPQLVTHYKSDRGSVDASEVRIHVDVGDDW